MASRRKEIEQADQDRIADERNAELKQGDESRMLAARRESELNRIAGDLPDDPKALWMYAEHSLAQASVSSIDAGRALIKLKERLPYGEFGPGLEERGITTSTASNLMQVARRFSNRLEKFHKLGRSKLYACLELSDDDLDTLEAGGDVLGMTLDDMDRMTRRELKVKLKKQDADAEISGKLAEDKNRKIDEQAAEIERLKGNALAGESSEAVKAIESFKLQAVFPLAQLRALAEQMEAEPDTVRREDWYALRAALDALRDEMARAWPAIWEAGRQFETELEMATEPVHQPNQANIQ